MSGPPNIGKEGTNAGCQKRVVYPANPFLCGRYVVICTTISQKWGGNRRCTTSPILCIRQKLVTPVQRNDARYSRDSPHNAYTSAQTSDTVEKGMIGDPPTNEKPRKRPSGPPCSRLVHCLCTYSRLLLTLFECLPRPYYKTNTNGPS